MVYLCTSSGWLSFLCEMFVHCVCGCGFIMWYCGVLFVLVCVVVFCWYVCLVGISLGAGEYPMTYVYYLHVVIKRGAGLNN